MTILAIFRSRSQTLDFIAKLKNEGMTAVPINTPKEANVGCGLSAKIDAYVYGRTKLWASRYSSFVGFYKSDFMYGRQYISPLNEMY